MNEPSDTRPLLLHVVHRFDFGGLENGIVNLVNRLPATDYRHGVLCMTTTGRFADRLEPADVVIVTLNKQPGKDLASYFRLWRQLRELRPAIVHSRNVGTIDSQLIAALAGVPVRIHGEHGWDASDPAGSNVKYKVLRRMLSPLIHRFVTMSDDLRRWMLDDVGISGHKVVRIYNGVDIQRFTPKQHAQHDTGPVVFGTVGRLDRIKNQGLLIRALAGVAKQRSSAVRLVIVGDGPMRGELTALAAELGIEVEFTGLRDDVQQLMTEMDVFVLPSLNEGISNTLLEAMASGLPVIATRVGGNVELVRDGETGFLFPSEGEKELVDAMTEYVDSAGLRLKHGTAGRARVEQFFSMDSMLSRYQQLYNSLLSARGAAYLTG